MKKIIRLFLVCSLFLGVLLTATSCRRGYTVDFETNGGEPQIEEITVRPNKVVAEPTAPSKEGHTFDGWFLDVDFSQKYDFNTKVKNDFTLYAKWNVNSYTINFNSNGGTEIEASTYAYGSTIKAPTAPTKTGYQFDAWYTDEAFSNRFDWNSKMPAKNLTLYAKWVANTYEVTFISLGVELSNLTQTVEHGKNVAVPQEVERIGYSFDGWYLGSAKYDFNTPVTKDIELSAVWKINSYTFSFDTVGGSEIADVVYEYNATIVRPENPTKTGYTFAGWMSGNEVFSFANAKMPANNLELTAVWTANDYVITFNKNNVLATGTVANIDAKYDANVNIAANAFALTGYTFKEWNTKADGTGTAYQPNQSVSKLAASGIVELYAIWEVNSYSVSFDANGGTGTMAAQSFTYGVAANLTANTFTKVGYTFDGWATSANGTKVYNNEASYTTGAENVTLYAIWKANSYTVTFNANGGVNTMAAQSFVYDTENNLNTNQFTLTGSTFAGWATSANGEVVYTNGQKVKNLATSGNVELFAVWEKIDYTLTVSLSQTESYTFTLHYGDSIAASLNSINTNKEGAEFDGWYAYINNEWVSINPAEVTMPAGNLAVGAKYLGQVLISFIVDGEAYDIVNGLEGEEITKVVTNPTKEGYSFGGWYTDDNTFLNSYTLPEVFPSENVFVYAKFTINSYKVSFVTNTSDELEDLTLTYGSAIEVSLSKTGYSLTWYTDEDFENRADLVVPAHDVTLYAKWTANEYSVVYNINSSDATGEVATQDVKYDQTFNLANGGFTLTGYKILQWNTQADGKGTFYNVNESVTNLATEGEITLYAYWTPIVYKVRFDSNTGTGSMLEQMFIYDVADNLKANLNPETGLPYITKEGHTFKGWATSPASPKVYNDGAEVIKLASENNAEITLYAYWEINTFTVSFLNEVGGTIITKTVDWNTDLKSVLPPNVEKVGHEYTWYKDGVAINLDTTDIKVISNIEIKVGYKALTYTVHFMVGNKPIYTVVQEYGQSISFDQLLTDTGNTIATLEEIEPLVDALLTAYMNLNMETYEGWDNVVAASTALGTYYYMNGAKIEALAVNAPNVYIEFMNVMANLEGNAYDQASNLYSIMNTELLTLKPLYSIYNQNGGKPKKEGYIFKGWVLGEDTLYDDKKTGDVWEEVKNEENDQLIGKTPAAKNPGEPAYLVALFAGITPINDYTVDTINTNKLTWSVPNLEGVYDKETQIAIITYDIYSYVSENGVAKYEYIATENTNSYELSTDNLQPGTYQIKVIANVTIYAKDENGYQGQLVEKLTSEFGENFGHITLTLSTSGSLDNVQAGDYYYYGVENKDTENEIEVFYFYTNMTYNFQTTNFVIVDADNEKENDYVKVDTFTDINDNNFDSILKIKNKVGTFYFQNGTKTYKANVLPYVSSFYFGENLIQFETYSTPETNTSLFLNASSAVYQVGVEGTYIAADHKVQIEGTDYYNGFVFDLDVRTSGGEKIDYSLYPDFLIYSFSILNDDGSIKETVHYLFDSEEGLYVSHKFNNETKKYEKDITNLTQIGHYINGEWYFDSGLKGEKIKVEISIKDIYVANKLVVDGKITAQSLVIELNDRANVYSHESLKAIYGDLNLKAGINIHANITPKLLDTQRYTQAAIDAGNPYILNNTHPDETNILDGAPVNVGMHFIRRDNYITNTFSGNVYSRVSNGGYAESNKEEYIISGNLFTIDGSNLPYANTKHFYWEDNPTIPAINLSNVAGYEIACMESAIFLYLNIKGGDDYAGFSEESNGKLIINDLNIKGNTTVPQIVDSSSGEFESSLAVMNRNSGGYLGVFAPFGADMDINNTVITNTTIAVKFMNGETVANFDYFYTGHNWSNSVMGRNNGKFTFTRSVFKDSGGAALFFDDHLSNEYTGDIDCTVRVSNDTIIENFISGEEGYFKAYNLVFPVMKMKTMLNDGVEAGSGGALTMMYDDKDDYTNLTTQKVNFIFLSLPIEQNIWTGGKGVSRVKFEYFNIDEGGYVTYDSSDIVDVKPNNTAVIIKENYTHPEWGVDLPLRGVVLTFQTIAPGQNAFMVAGAFQPGLYD